MPTLLDDLSSAVRLIGIEPALHAALYPFRKAWTEARWEHPQHPRRGLRQWLALGRQLGRPPIVWPTRWEHPGRVGFIIPHERGATLTTKNCTLDITFFAADMVRVHYRPRAHGHVPATIPYAIAKPLEAWPVPAVVSVETEKVLWLRSEALTVGIALADAQVFIADAAGHLLRADVDVAWHKDGALRHRTALAPEEHLFGLGERATRWNRRGHTHILWNRDPSGYTNDDDPINLNIPVYISAQASRDPNQQTRAAAQQSSSAAENHASHITQHAVFYENPYYAEFDLGDSVPNVAEHRFAGGELRYYVIAGTTPHLLERYTELTGRHALPPLWMLGYQQSRWSYYPEARVRKLAEDFRAHDVPCDAIHLDIHYMDGYRCFTWDKKRFPHMATLAADLRAQGIKLVAIIDAGIKKDSTYSVYRSGLAGRHFCATPDGKVFHAPVWPGLSAFPDFTAPQTRQWWGAQYKPLLEAGIAGFWNDMNEPAIFASNGDPTLPHPIRHSLEGRGGDHREAHNVYGMQMARAGQAGLLAQQPDVRPVLITRAGWAGVQRYAISWTGDNESTWASLRLTMPMVMGLGLSGLGFSGPDTGGFKGAADGELFTRWIQMAAFMPFFRAHTVAGTPDQEPWSYGEPYLSIVRRFIQLRYELLPYLYTAVWQMTTRGWPVVRPLWWNDADEALMNVDDAFLCGDALLVAPIGAPGATSRPVPLPAGVWYDFWTNERQATASVQCVDTFAALETIPLFVRAGSILPMGEYGSSVEQRGQKFLRLSVYPLAGPGETVSELYEDAGEGFGYRQGDYRLNRFVLRQTDDHLTVTWAREGDYQPPYEHIELTLNGLQRAPRHVRADGVAYGIVVSDPIRRSVMLGVPPFETLEVTL
ncbi:MAG TPA: glycoside hydrolase family 31 protein [Anaerolineae bacterium]|nr:glycoside hydrolase family 31 protein [Anaerolineae bacterium]HQH38098.1 glycoside hydrolase family 31 protein [Anaerolineae bacterium]